MHAVIMKAADPAPDSRVLWRIDEDESSLVLYVTSERVPNLEELHEAAGWVGGLGQQTADYRPFLDKLSIDSTYRFRLAANPTHLVTRNGVKKRTAHVTATHQVNWLLKKAEQHGFEVLRGDLNDPQQPSEKALDLAVVERSMLTFRRQSKTVTLAKASFIGQLRITDPELMRTTLTAGIGPAKAYGCGLLTLSAPR